MRHSLRSSRTLRPATSSRLRAALCPQLQQVSPACREGLAGSRAQRVPAEAPSTTTANRRPGMKLGSALAFLALAALTPPVPAVAAKDDKLPRCNGRQKRPANLYGTVLPSIPSRGITSEPAAPAAGGVPRGTPHARIVTLWDETPGRWLGRRGKRRIEPCPAGSRPTCLGFNATGRR